MAKRHDENKCLRSFKRIGRIDMYDKILQAPKNAVIGIHLWGKIDYLTKYCGWHFIWNNNATPVYIQNSDDYFDMVGKASESVKKKQKKEHKLTDKTKKNTKKK